MKSALSKFWLLCLIPRVIPLYFLPWELNTGLALAAFMAWARRTT